MGFRVVGFLTPSNHQKTLILSYNFEDLVRVVRRFWGCGLEYVELGSCLRSSLVKGINSYPMTRVSVDVFEDLRTPEAKQKTLDLLSFKVPNFEEKESLDHG